MEKTTQVQKQSSITDSVLARVTEMQKGNTLKLPADYSPENALKFAYLQLSEQAVNGKPVLQACSPESISNSLLKMVTQGLNPAKRQCSFIPYGGQLTLMREYQGSIALAKRCGLQHISANVIYQADVFEYSINADGTKSIIKHEQKIENIDLSKIKGAYAVVRMSDGSATAEIMSIDQIRKSWEQGATKGKSPAHNNFTDQMCIKTVINRACKPIINGSDDSYLYDDDDEPATPETVAKEQINRETVSEPLDVQEAEVIAEAAAEPAAKENEQLEAPFGE